jgi:hypothetical protein
MSDRRRESRDDVRREQNMRRSGVRGDAARRSRSREGREGSEGLRTRAGEHPGAAWGAQERAGWRFKCERSKGFSYKIATRFS